MPDSPETSLVTAAVALTAAAGETSREPLETVIAALRVTRLADRVLRDAVDAARVAGHTWQELGAVLSVSRQAAFQRFGRPIDPRTGEPMANNILAGVGEHALALLGEITQGHWDAVCRDFDETMTRQLDGSKIAAVWSQVIGSIGAFEHTGEPLVHQSGDYTIVEVPLYFEAGEMTGRLSYDRNRKVAGLFITRPGSPR